jgi:transposase
MTAAQYIGIDIAKAELVVATSTTVLGSFANDRHGHGELVKRLGEMSVAGVVIESTGCYGRPVGLAVSAAGFPVAIVQPGRVRHFALSHGIRAKTDAIDARLIAQFGECYKPRAWAMPPEVLTRLRALVDRRDQIVESRKREQNYLESCADTGIAKELRSSIVGLEKQELAYTERIAHHIAEHDRLQRLSEALQAESGVGLQTVAVLLAYMPELGCLNRQQAAALVGFAPYNQDSGPRKGTRGIAGGRRRLRRALYMAAISASRWNAWIAPMYRRLRERGKHAKVALVACGRKLVIRLNSIAATTLAETAAQDDCGQPG